MSSFWKGLMGQKPHEKAASGDSDFADFADYAGEPSPVPVSLGSAGSSIPARPTGSVGYTGTAVPYTKWYRVWERTQLSDFKNEAITFPFLVLGALIFLWGVKVNRKRARKWIAAYGPVLQSEFALVGYSNELSKSEEPITEENIPTGVMKEKSVQLYESYATGRQNIAFVDLKLQLLRLHNIPFLASEWLLAQFFDGISPPAQVMDVAIYAFDGNEKKFVLPGPPGSDELAVKGGSSTYDGFVFAIVNKSAMKKLRDERYDISLTFTKEHAKLPYWATVMSESAEITDAMLTKDLISAVEKAGEALDYLIVSDQPLDKPAKESEAVPRKRLFLRMKIPSDSDHSSALPLFRAFLRLPDYLVQSARFRPEVTKKLNQTREAEIKKLKKLGDEEVEDERKKAAERLKKEERDRKMKGMSADEQRKFLEKENERNRKKAEKRMVKKG